VRITPVRLLAVAAVGAAVALAITQIDFESALREVTLPLRHDDIIRQQAAEKHLDPGLIAAVIYEESRFREQTSSAGARGLMQVTPETAVRIARLSGGTEFVPDDLSDPDINIRYGSYWLSHLLDRYSGNLVAALAAYNAGEAHADRWGGSSLRVGRIGFPETRVYVENVLETREEYREHYAEDLGLEGG
jgi:soluble lytic murein transglycosylase